MSSVVEQIKGRINIADLAASYVKLAKSGANLKGRCPFHNEKTPSFFVSPDRGTFYCFGCNAKGDIFSFVQQLEGLDFPQALKMLAEKAGVTISPQEFQVEKNQKSLYTVLEAATIFFERSLSGAGDNVSASAGVSAPAARKYLTGRGLKEETVHNWRIGYAGDEWRSLYEHLLSADFTAEEMLATGLIKKTSGGEGYYDVFRSRIIFPIWNAAGKIVAFSGRIFPEQKDDSAPKYLNSPETALFKKSDTLYGFDKAKTAIRRKGYAIVVEGQMDLIMSHQAGFQNTVATSGTALTEFHLNRLARIAPRVMFAYDSDDAGRAAARRAAELGLRLGLEVKLASLPEGEDPASLLLKNPSVYSRAIKNSEHVIDFCLAAVLRETQNDRERRQRISREVFPLMAMLKSSVEQTSSLRKISGATGFREEDLRDDFKSFISQAKTAKIYGDNASHQTEDPHKTKSSKQPVSRKSSIERTILGVVYWQKDAMLADELKKIIGEQRYAALEAELADEKDALIFEVEKYFDGSDKMKNLTADLLKELQAEELKTEFAQTMSLLRVAEQARDPVRVEDLLKKCNEISGRLIKLERVSDEAK